MAADSHRRKQMVNPCLLHLQKMELELKCPSCLKLLSNPMLLPCNHICCSPCITRTSDSSARCPACASPFPFQDARAVPHVEMIVTIFKSMSSTFAAHFLQPGGQLTPEKKPGESAEGMKSSITQSGNTRKNACIAEDSCSPPSFGDVKESDDDINDCKSGQLSGASCKRKLGDATERQENLPESCLSNKRINHGNIRGTDDEIHPKQFKNSSDRQIDSSTSGLDLSGNNSSPYNNTDRDCMTSSTPSKDEMKAPLTSNRAVCSSDGLPSMTCVFCHSFSESAASGPMLHYDNGNPVEKDRAHGSNIMHVHEKCIEWAPQVYFVGDVAKGLEAEISRAAKIKCSQCGKKGAALGCYAKSCRKSFHVPCAVEIPGCRWDNDNFLVLCPAHTFHKLPSDRSKNKKKVDSTLSSNASDIQKPSANLGNMSQLDDSLWKSSPDATQGWVLCGSALSTAENALLAKFAKIIGASISKDWTQNVTHVIASVDESGACSRTFKYLMAILSGKWILRLDWINACLEAKCPVAEDNFEIKCDIHGCLDGPKNGRMRIVEKAPPLFDAMGFCFSGKFRSSYRRYLEGLISVAGGSIFDGIPLSTSDDRNLMLSKSFVVCNLDPPEDCDLAEQASVIKQRLEEAEALASKSGSQVVAHTWILDCIAACKIQTWSAERVGMP